MKSLSIAIDDALRGKSVRAALLTAFELTTGTHYFWSGAGTLTWDGRDFLGVGRLGRISGAGETAEIRTTETSYTIAGVTDFPQLSEFLDTPVRGCHARAWLALLDDNGVVIPDPILIDESILDTVTTSIAEDGSAVVTLNATSAVFYWQRPISRYITNEDQQVDFAGDTGFDRIPTEVASKQVSWTRT